MKVAKQGHLVDVNDFTLLHSNKTLVAFTHSGEEKVAAFSKAPCNDAQYRRHGGNLNNNFQTCYYDC